MPPVLCEVCIDSVQGAVAAADGGADRVELCANLVEGGTTPSTGMIRAVLAACSLPVMVMIRPRGGHFVFNATEQTTMLRELEAVLAEPVAGVVVGAVRTNGELDEACVRKLCELTRGRSITFHRAFDQVRDPAHTLAQLIDCGVDRILTSGQAPTAVQAVERLRDLVLVAAGRCSIMPGCGVRADNVARILADTGAHEIHFSGARLTDCPVEFWRSEVPMSAETTPGDLRRRLATAAEIAAICAAARSNAVNGFLNDERISE